MHLKNKKNGRIEIMSPEEQVKVLERQISEVKGEPTEVYSRIVGYFRPVANWNDGKQEEYKNRKTYNVGEVRKVQ
jgi:hypothetical protein